MIRTPDDPNVFGFTYRYRVIEVIGVTPEIELSDGSIHAETIFEGSDTREFRTLAGAEAYADKLRHRGRGHWPTVIQTGKLLWLTEEGKQAEIARIDGETSTFVDRIRAAANEGRNAMPDADDDQARAIEAFALALLREVER